MLKHKKEKSKDGIRNDKEETQMESVPSTASGIFITGTDTGVGKTYVAKAIAESLRREDYKVALMKPIVAGGMSDVNRLKAVNVYSFKAVLAPSVAAKLENKNISIEKILSCYKKLCKENDFVIVEGIGGLLVPIKKGYLVSDLIIDMDVPAIVVARPGLGTINHTLLTVKYAENCGIKILGVIFNETKKIKTGICERTNPKEIHRECGVPVLGYVRYCRGDPLWSPCNGQAQGPAPTITRRLLAMMRQPRIASQYEALDKRYVWHPFTQMQDWQKEKPLIIESARGCYLKSTEGKWYLDGVSSLWVNVHGHRKKQLDSALIRQIGKVSHSTLLGLGNVPSVELAKMLVDIAPKGLNKVFYSDNGSTAVEVALKMAFQYWQEKGRIGRDKEATRKDKDRIRRNKEGISRYREYREKTKFVSFVNAYHGDTIGSVSVGGIDLFHKTYKPLLFKTIKAKYPYCYRCHHKYPQCKFNCIKQLENILQKRHNEIAAVIIEPLVQAAAGMLVSPVGFLKKVRRLCTRYDCLMICDEVATGFGRTGEMFACEVEDVSPDIMSVAKSISAGYLPIAATLTTDEIYDAFCGNYSQQRTFFHGHTYTGNPLAAAVAVGNLKLFKTEDTLKKLKPKISFLKKCLTPFWDLQHVGDIRQKGFMVGIELVAGKNTKRPYNWKDKIGIKVIMKAMQMGVILRPLGDIIVLMPPLAITLNELKRLLSVTYMAIDEVTSG